MNLKKIKLIYFGMLIILILSFGIEVNAATLPKSNTCYYFNRTTGKYSKTKLSDSYAKDCVKELEGDSYVNDKKAFCVQWGKSIKTSSYKRDTSWNPKSKRAILAGMIISSVYADYDGTEAYAITSATLNTFFRKYVGTSASAGSKNFYGNNDKVKKYYDEAINKYKDNNYTTSTKIPKPTIKSIDSSDSDDFEYRTSTSGNYYLSKQITFDLTKSYGGKTVTYKLSVNKNAQICNKYGKSCTTTKEITGEDSYTFRIKALTSNVSEGDTVKATITGTNSSTYASSYRYIGTNYTNSTQKLLIKTTTTIDRKTSNSLQLTIPDLVNHMIKVIKVDEYGEELTGASLAIYKDDPNATEPLKTNSNGSSEVVYKTPKTTESADDFFNHNYYFVEKSSPNGYVLKAPILIYEKGNKNSTTTSTKCYNTENEEMKEADSLERCNFENYSLVCLDEANTIIEEVSPTDGCVVTKVETEAETGIETTTTINYKTACYNKEKSEPTDDMTYCTEKDKYTKVKSTNENIIVTQSNALNKVYISKKDITGDEEIIGASLKICTESSYNSKKEECTAATTIDNTEMAWESTSSTKEFSGIPSGTYYIIEVLPPNGYIKETTTTKFVVNANGKVTSNKKEVTEENPIIINNQTNSLSISKQDITTSKELPGATLSICLTYTDESTNEVKLEIDEVTGDCIPAVLADGTEATWTSTDKSHIIKGLAAGTYYLVEQIAPTNYSTAESILFKVNEDGKILDINNKVVTNNKIIMKDEKLKEVKTGDLPIIAIITICMAGLATGAICYHYSNQKYGLI